MSDSTFPNLHPASVDRLGKTPGIIFIQQHPFTSQTSIAVETMTFKNDDDSHRFCNSMTGTSGQRAHKWDHPRLNSPLRCWPISADSQISGFPHKRGRSSFRASRNPRHARHKKSIPLLERE